MAHLQLQYLDRQHWTASMVGATTLYQALTGQNMHVEVGGFEANSFVDHNHLLYIRPIDMLAFSSTFRSQSEPLVPSLVKT